jgi:hypothetical protein
MFDVFYVGSIAMMVLFGLAVSGDSRLASVPYIVSAVIAFGPIALGIGLYVVSGDPESPIWPFHKEPVSMTACATSSYTSQSHALCTVLLPV